MDAAFSMQIPELIALAAAGSEGGSTRDGLTLPIGERGLYWLPFNHICIHSCCSVSVFPFSLRYCLYSGPQHITSLLYSFPIWKHW